MNHPRNIRRPLSAALAAAVCALTVTTGAIAQTEDAARDADRARAEEQRLQDQAREEERRRLREEERRLREEERGLREQERTVRDQERQMRREEEQMRKAEERLRAAEARLAEAAREVAEINRSLTPSAMRLAEQIAITSDRPRLGVALGQEVTETSGGERTDEIRVLSVTPGSPADEAGVRAGDALASIDGRALASGGMDDALRIVREVLDTKNEGDTVRLGIVRGGQPSELTLSLGDNAFQPNVFAFQFGDAPVVAPDVGDIRKRVEVLRNGDGEYAYSMFFGGLQSPLADMELVELTPELGDYFGTDSGLLVVRAPRGDAFELQDGDVIRSIGGREPESVRHAMRILRSYTPGETMELEIMRKKRRRTLSVQVPEPAAPEPVIAPKGWIPAPAVPAAAAAAPAPGASPAPAAPPSSADRTTL